MPKEFKTTFGLDDKLTAPLNRMIKLLDSFNEILEDAEGGLSDFGSQDLSELNNGLGNVEKSAGNVKKGLNSLSNTSFGGLDKDINRLNQTLSQLENGAESTRSSIKQIENVSLSGVKSESNKAKAGLSDLGEEAKSVRDEIQGIGDVDIADSLSGLSDAIDLNNFLNLTELAQSAADAVIEIGSASLDAAENVTNAMNTIELGLNVTDEQAQKLHQTARDVFTGGFGDSIGEVTNQLVEMKQILGSTVTDSELEQLLPTFISLDQQGMDFNETLRGVKNLMSGFGLDAQTATGYMVEGFQRGLNQSDELGDNIAEYSARWGEAGVSAGTYFSLLETGLNNSSYNLDKVGDFLNEFLTSLSDGRMDEVMGSLSENSRQVFEAYKNDGANAQDVLNAVLTDFQGITSETDKAALASQLWSSLGEDNAMGMIESLNGVKDTYGNVTAEAQNFADTSTNNVTQMKNMWQDWKDNTLAPIGDALAGVAVTVMSTFGDMQYALEQAGSVISAKAQEIGSNILNGLTQGLDNTITSVTTWFDTNFGWLIQHVKDILGIASPSTIFSDIGGNLIQGFWDGVQNIWNAVTGWFDTTFKGLIDKVKGWVSNIFGGGDQGNAAQIDFTKTNEQLEILQQNVQKTFEQVSAQARQITEMCSVVIANFNAMVTKSLAYLAQMQTTTIATITNMTTQTLNLVLTFNRNYLTAWTNTQTTVVGIVSDMSRMIVALIQTMSNQITTIMRDLTLSMRTAGVNMMTSLRSGIASQMGSVTSTAGSLVQQLKSTFEKGLGIHSPSDYMIWVGQMMLAGLLQGMSGSQVQKFIESMITDMQSSFEAGKFNANELVNFLSDSATLNLIGRVTGMDMKGVKAEQIAYPLIGTLGTQTSWFGPRESPGGIGSTNHGGVDLAAPTGTPIAAALAGNVTTAGWYGGYGNAVVIDSGNGIDITYGHMSQVLAQVGQSVNKGAQIGLVGSTGNSTGPHLHFEMHQNGERIDPQPFIEGASISAGNTLANAIQNAYNIKHGLAPATMGLATANYDVSAGASQWAPQVLQALAMLGQPASLLQGVLYAIESESGGNPNATNNWDINAQNGDPSRGLLQTIGGTFEAYRNPSLSNNIFDPLANIYAGLNYMIQRYGSIASVVNPRLGNWYGYAVGTRYVPQDMLAMIHEGEAIIPAGQNPYSQSGGDYLGDIASRIVDGGNAVENNTYIPNSTGASVISVGNINTTVNVSGNSGNPNDIARTVSDQIMRDLRSAFERKGGVSRDY